MSRSLRGGVAVLCLVGAGCASLASPFPPSAFIRTPVTVPAAGSASPPAPLPEPPPERPRPPAAAPGGDLDASKSAPIAKRARQELSLNAVMLSVDTHFPLLAAIEQERAIAAGRRTAAEGQFDLMLRARGAEQGGTFSNGRLDVGAEQATPFGGATTFAGWRLGQGSFPIYYGDRKTGDGGEFRVGVTLPLLQNRDIDPRRARVRAAQISERLAEPQIRRARLDAFRAAAQAYWSWVSAGTLHEIAAELLHLARDRQRLIDEQRLAQLAPETTQALNRRLTLGREEQLLAAERAVQAAAIRLSLYLRDAYGEPVTPSWEALPRRFLEFEPPPPELSALAADVRFAEERRPELARFALQKELVEVERRLAENQRLPALNAVAAVGQDAGAAKKTFTGEGPFRTDRTAAEAGLTFELPLQRRDAAGRSAAAQAQSTQLLLQERYARDEITAQVRDALSELDRTHRRIGKTRGELREAVRVRVLETESFRAGRTSLVDLNLHEIAAAEAKAKLAGVLANYCRAAAEYRAAIGADPADPENAQGAALPASFGLGGDEPEPAVPLPAPAPLPGPSAPRPNP